MRTNPGTKLAELTINDKVAFEADGITSDEAWSVVIIGTARTLQSQTEIDDADKLPLQPWIPTRKYTYVEITPSEVHGRHFDLGSEPDRYLPDDPLRDASRSMTLPVRKSGLQTRRHDVKHSGSSQPRRISHASRQL